MGHSEFKLNIAVVIGINNYQNGVSTLGNARQDAKAIAQILKDDYNYDQVHLFTDNQATAQNLTKFLETELPDILKTDTPSRLLFYFAGHGIALNGDDGAQGYLIPQDAKSGDSSTYIPMPKVETAITKLECRHCLIILDCCFGGAFRWSSTRKAVYVPETIYKERYDRFIKDPAWQVITSAGSDQYASDSLILKDDRGKAQNSNHSPFAYALINALQGKADIYPVSKNGKPSGDGIITATELYMYLRDEVEPLSEEHHKRQTPLIWSLKKHDKGEFIFLIPGHPLNLENAPPLDESRNPYRGLKSYDEKHSDLFFGRTELSYKLLDFVKNHPLTVVLGASGSGKSSLVKAGLIPQLRKETTEKWFILPPIRPSETPLQALNNALKKAKLPEIEPQNPEQNLAKSIDIWAKNHPNSQLLLFIDQSEELITLCKKEDDRQEFFQQILTAINAHRDKLRVVLTLRSDFEPQIRDLGLKFVPKDYSVQITEESARNTELKNRWQNARFIVPAMTRGELREAIEKPAEARVMYFDPHDLVEQLIDEVDDMPGALPLLSFALSELYLKYLQRQREAENTGDTIDRALTQKDYEDLGGVILSLTQKADEEYEALVKENSAYAQIIRHIMLRMVALGGGELARRKVPLSELEYPPEKNDLVKKVIERFTEARLLVTGEDNEGNPYVEPAHDALVRGWKRLLEWKQKNEESLLLQRRLTPAAMEWENQQQTRFLWNANPRLDLLKKVSKSDDNWLNKVEAEFVQRSVGRKSFNARRNWGIAISVMLGLSGLTIAALYQAQLSSLREKVAVATNRLADDEPINGLVLAIDAIGQNRSWLPWDILSPVQSSLFTAVEKAKESDKYTIKGQESIISAAFSPDGKYLATGDGFVPLGGASGGYNGTIWLRDIQGDSLSKPIHIKPQGQVGFAQVDFIAFSSDSKYIASYISRDDVKVWDLQGNLIKTQPGPSEIGPDTIMVANVGKNKIVLRRDSSADLKALSRDDQYLATVEGKNNEMIKVWNNVNQKNRDEQQPLFTFKGCQTRILALSFSPDNRSINGVCSDNTIRIWNLQDNSLNRESEYGSYVSSMAFTPDSKNIVVSDIEKGDEHQSVNIWNIESNKYKSLKTELNSINSLAVSPNGQYIIIAGDSILQLRNINGDQIDKPFKGHERHIESVAFSPDNKYIVSGSYDRTIRLWNLEGENIKIIELDNNKNLSAKKPFKIKEEVWSIKSVAISSDNKYIVAGISTDEFDIDGIVQLLDIKGNPIGQPFGNDWRFALSPNGKYIAIANKNNTIQLWDMKGNRVGSRFLGHENSITSLAFSPDGHFIVSGSYDNTVKLWDTQGNLINSFLGLPVIKSVIFSPDGQYIASTIYDQDSANYYRPLKLWPGSWKTMLKVACNRLKHHPILTDPKSDSEKSAARTCLSYKKKTSETIYNTKE